MPITYFRSYPRSCLSLLYFKIVKFSIPINELMTSRNKTLSCTYLLLSPLRTQNQNTIITTQFNTCEVRKLIGHLALSLLIANLLQLEIRTHKQIEYVKYDTRYTENVLCFPYFYVPSTYPIWCISSHLFNAINMCSKQM